LVERLQKLGVLDHTLILFLSDNGCSAEGGPGGFHRGDTSAPIGTATTYASAGLEWANVSDTPLRRFKKSTHEGGIASPLIAHWPAGITRRGEFVQQPGHVMDLMPTCLELAGAEYPPARQSRVLPPLEGRSLVPAFGGEAMAREALYWEHLGNRAVRAGDLKLVAAHKDAWELYDLAADRTELVDLAEQCPDKVAELAARWDAWALRCGVEPWPVKSPKK
jgi:arylsulfatase